VTAQLTASTESIGNRILDMAETRTGAWYVYGGAGPSVFDCSGLVYWASHKLGVNMPRTTYGMLASSHLYRVYSPRRGDLAFYGSGHVEFVTTWYHTTFGAQNSGTRVGWHRWNAYWHPTMYFRIR
jgi:cell wall-associated NlpC family hydrolase